jgi:hypothetical protein
MTPWVPPVLRVLVLVGSTSASIEDPSPVQKTPSPVEKSVEKSVRKSSKKKKWDKGEEHQKLVLTMVSRLQDDFREFMTRHEAFSNRLLMEADKKNDRANQRNEREKEQAAREKEQADRERLHSQRENLRLRLEIAKAMGDIKEMKKVMEESRML